MGLQFNFTKVVTATTDPTVADGLSNNYLVGTVWVNSVSNQYFVCTDNTDGAAVWIPDLSLSTDSSLEYDGYDLQLQNDVEVPGAFKYFGTGVAGEKGWYSLSSIAADQLELIAASSNLYRFLLFNSPFKKCHYNILSQDIPAMWSGTSVVYNNETFSYTVGVGSVLTTENVISSGVNTRSFFLYVESTAAYKAYYSTDGFSFTEFDPTDYVDLGDHHPALKVRIEFISAGEFKSYGIYFDDQPGVYYEFTEVSFDTKVIVEKQLSVSGQNTFNLNTFTFEPSAHDLSVYITGVLFDDTEYMKIDPNTITLGTTATSGSSTLPANYDVLFDIHRDLANFDIEYEEYIITATAGQTDFTTPFNFTAGNKELAVTINGIRQYPDAFDEYPNNKVVFTEALTILDTVLIRVYKRNGLNLKHYQCIQVASALQLEFLVPFEYINDGRHLMVYIDGVRQAPDAYIEISNNRIVFTEQLDFNDKVMFSILKYRET
jgi:hypothetical protein